jgi:hypothetical protein
MESQTIYVDEERPIRMRKICNSHRIARPVFNGELLLWFGQSGSSHGLQ